MNITEKCKLLESLGFEIDHEDSRVTMNGMTFDFSATLAEPWAIIQTAIVSAHDIGYSTGVSETQDKIKQVLGIEGAIK